jgi:hypothetical protein
MDLFNASDGSKYRIVTARWLSQVPVWKGNRVIDMTHVDRIREGLKGNIPLLNANPFRLAFVKEDNDVVTRYIIDGQHRFTVCKDLGLPIHYLLVDSLGLEEVQTLINLIKSRIVNE